MPLEMEEEKNIVGVELERETLERSEEAIVVVIVVAVVVVVVVIVGECEREIGGEGRRR